MNGRRASLTCHRKVPQTQLVHSLDKWHEINALDRQFRSHSAVGFLRKV